MRRTPRHRAEAAAPGCAGGNAGATDDSGVTLEQKIAALCRPETYASAPARIEVIETHMAFVFLTPEHAYKLKKPVRYDFLDFSTPLLRKQSCEEELRLNQRLARGIYLCVISLCRTATGRLRLGIDGRPVEWLVQMRRLPQHLMLDEKIKRGTLVDRDLAALAARLAEFYGGCLPEPITAAEYAVRLRTEAERDRRALRVHGGALDATIIERLYAIHFDFLQRHFALIEQRVREGRIIEGHGDLRPEHVCLLDEPVIFDSLEFDRSLRIVDALDELAFLAMECERLGAAHAGARVIAAYADLSGDTPPSALVDYYKSRRASLRARFSILHVRELEDAAAVRWTTQATQYLRIALEYAQRIA